MPKILLIDDSAFARKTLKQLLGDQFSYAEASDGLSGLEAYFLEHPDLVILDITMPGVSGLEILQQLKTLDSQAKVIICSADIQEYSRSRAMELGAAAFVGKPATAQSLLAAIQPALENKGGG